MTITVLRHNSRTILNFTRRIVLQRTDLVFETGPASVGTGTPFSIQIVDFAKFLGSVDPRCEVTVTFRLTGTNHWYEDMGSAADLVRRGGRVRGITRGGFNPVLLGADITVSDPRENSEIVLTGSMSKPDATDARIEIEDDAKPEPIKPFRAAESQSDSAIDIVESADAVGYWSLDLTGQCVRMLVSPALSKDAVISDPRTMRAVHPAAYRQILQSMVFQEERFADMKWFSVWKKFTTEDVLPGERWDALFEASIEDDVREENIDDAVAAFSRQFLPETGLPPFTTAQSEGE